MKNSRLSSILFLCIFAIALAGSSCNIQLPGAQWQTPEGWNAEEAEAFNRINDERAARGLQALIPDTDLHAVARAHSQDMVDRDFFDHTNPDGLSPFQRMAAAGITYSKAAENIAWNQGHSNPAQTAVTAWMNSTGHRNNILNDTYTHTGMGVAATNDGKYYFTQVFTKP
ncbi:CAP domain-containing protein [Candidatus Hydrogenedentota bacterium]